MQHHGKRGNRRGQSTLELAVLLIVITVAFIALERYVKFAAAGRLKSSADSLSQTLFNPHEGRTQLTVDRTSIDMVAMNGTTVPAATRDLTPTHAGKMVSTTNPGGDVNTRIDKACLDGSTTC